MLVITAETTIKHLGGNNQRLCPLSDKYLAELTGLQNVLTEVLDKQQALTDNLVQRSRLAAWKHTYLLLTSSLTGPEL